MSSIKNVVIAVLFGLAAVFIAYHLGDWRGKAKGGTDAVARSNEAHIEVREKQNEARNNRPDRQRLVNSMRQHRF